MYNDVVCVQLQSRHTLAQKCMTHYNEHENGG